MSVIKGYILYLCLASTNISNQLGLKFKLRIIFDKGY